MYNVVSLWKILKHDCVSRQETFFPKVLLPVTANPHYTACHLTGHWLNSLLHAGDGGQYLHNTKSGLLCGLHLLLASLVALTLSRTACHQGRQPSLAVGPQVVVLSVYGVLTDVTK